MFKRLILKNFKPALTKKVKVIDLDLDHNVNVLIGPNGIGKSSILRECSVFPAENKNFTGNGYKYVEKVFNGHLFQLESHTGSKARHSFKIDGGEELNPNGTQTVQRELIQQYLFITPKQRDLLSCLDIGHRFSFLNATQRKELLMDLYPYDTKYAMSVFKKLTVSYRDTVGALRNLNKRLEEEKERYRKLQDLNNEDLLKRISTIDNQLKEALVFQGSLSNVEFDDKELQDLYRRFVRLTEELTLFDGSHLKIPIKVLPVLIKDTDGVIEYKKQIIKRLEDRINEITSSLSGISLSDQDPVKLESQIKLTEQQLKDVEERNKQLSKQLKTYPVFEKEDMRHLIPVTKDFISYLNAVVSRDPTNGVTGARYQQMSLNVTDYVNQIRNITSQIDDYEHSLKHYNGLEEVECEECKHRFKPGVKKEQVEGIILRLNKLKTDKVILEGKLKEAEDIVNSNADWYSTMLSLTSFIKDNKAVNHLLYLVQAYQIGDGETNSERLINALQINYKLVKSVEQADKLFEELKILKARLELLKRNDMVELIKEFNSTEEHLGECNSTLISLREVREGYVKQIEEINGYNLKLSMLMDYREKLLTMLANKGKVELRNRVEEVIAQLSPEKDRLVADLIRNKSSFNVITNIEENIALLKKRNLALKKLIDGLCPNKGYIGQLMSEFITTICGNMNSIIRDIWVSPLYVKPCNKDNSELNYLFPVINSYDNSANDDISDCSGGEREIIDWAAQIVFHKYSRAKLPIVMDEVGNMMDEVHRPRFFEYVKNFCQTKQVEQLFMVSHYIHQYGLLENANIIKLKAAK